MRIGVGADINGFELKELVKEHLVDQGHEDVDFGVERAEDVDYPDVGEPVARARLTANRTQSRIGMSLV